MKQLAEQRTTSNGQLSAHQLRVRYFFQGCKNPANVSEFILTLAAGQQLRASELPSELLPAAILLSCIGLSKYQQQIVDDYEALIDRMRELYTKPDCMLCRQGCCSAHEFTATPWHPQGHLVSFICMYGPYADYDLDGTFDAAYMFPLYETLVNQSVESLVMV